MRLLCLTPRLPWPPDRGDRLRAFHLLSTFARDHEVTLLSACERVAEAGDPGPLADRLHAVHVVPISRASSIASTLLHCWRRLPLQALYYRSRRFQRALVELRPRRFDAVYVHLFRLAPYVMPRERFGLYRILDLTDVISTEIERSLPYRAAPSRWLHRLEGRRIATFEKSLARSMEELWVVSEAEAKALRASAPGAPVRVIPNGFDPQLLDGPDQEPVEARLLFVGHMDVAHNLDAAGFLAREILPRVRRTHPRASLRLVGAGGGHGVERLGLEDGVEWAGYVADLGGELRRAAIFVAPLRFSAGLQNKVLEAMAVGRPVVTTPAVARGLAATDDRELLVGADAGSLAAQTTRLLDSPELRRRIGVAGQRHARERFSWDLARTRMRDLESELAGVRERRL